MAGKCARAPGVGRPYFDLQVGMRRVPVDHARSRHADKRGGGAVRLPLDDALNLSAEKAAVLVALDEALRESEYYRAAVGCRP
jgi:hypothetical protein